MEAENGIKWWDGASFLGPYPTLRGVSGLVWPDVVSIPWIVVWVGVVWRNRIGRIPVGYLNFHRFHYGTSPPPIYTWFSWPVEAQSKLAYVGVNCWYEKWKYAPFRMVSEFGRSWGKFLSA